MDVKPSQNLYAKFRCRACGRVWSARWVVLDESSTAVRWTCADLTCGGTVDEVREENQKHKAEQ